MTNRDDDSAWVTLIAAAIMLAIILAVVYVGGALECGGRWRQSGRDSRFGLISGCMVEESPGRWVPEGNYRAVAP